MGKTGRDIGPSSSVIINKQNHHFFKVFTPDNSSHQLKLPEAFINKLEEDLPKKVIFRDSIGKLWNVKVVKSGNDYFFQKGWEDFVNHYSLQYGNFVMFNYHGNSVFHVSVLDFDTQCEREDTIGGDSVIGSGKDACELEDSETESSDSEGVKLEETEVIANPQFTVTVNTRSYVTIPKQVVIDHGLELKTDMIIRVQNGKKWPVKVHCQDNSKRYVIGKGWHDFKTGNNMKHGDKCILEFKKGRGGKTSNVIKAYPSNGK